MRTITAILAILIGGLILHQPVVMAASVSKAPAPAAADADKSHHRAHHSGALSASEAAKIAQKQDGGARVLSVDHVDGGYRVKLLKKGEVRTVVVPEPAPQPAAAAPPPDLPH